jgi:hypothetical protein
VSRRINDDPASAEAVLAACGLWLLCSHGAAAPHPGFSCRAPGTGLHDVVPFDWHYPAGLRPAAIFHTDRPGTPATSTAN